MEETAAALELHTAALLQLSRDWFFVLQLAFLAVAGVLGHFVISKRLRNLKNRAPRALDFGVLMIVMLGAVAVFTKLWGYERAPFALGYGISVALSLVDPVVAVAFLLANSLIRPWELSDMAEMAFLPKMGFALALGSWAVHAARARKLSVLMNGPSKLFYALSGWFLLSALLSGDFMEGLQKYSGNVMIATIVFILVSNAPRDQEDINLLRKTLVVAISGLIMHALFVTLSQPDFDPSQMRLEDAGTVGNSNDLAAMITIALPLAVVPNFIKGRRTGLFGRFAIAISVLILFAGLAASQSRGAILALAIGAIGFGVARARDKKLAGIIAGFALLLVVAGSSLLTFARNSEDLQGSENSRIAFILAGVNMGLRNPIIGIGHDNFGKNWDAYAIGQTYESGSRSGHSSWLIAFAENGLPGLGMLVALFAMTFKRALRLRTRHPELLFAIISYGVAMTFLNHVYTIYPYLIFAMILAATRIEQRPAAALEERQEAA